jgi:hypothetical protein
MRSMVEAHVCEWAVLLPPLRLASLATSPA